MNKKEQQIIDMMKALDISREEAEDFLAELWLIKAKQSLLLLTWQV